MLLLNGDIKEFLKFLKINNINNIFYNYTFYNKENYVINEFIVNSSEQDIYNFIKNDIKNYNEEIKSLDFLEPKTLQIFCLHDTEYIGILFNNFWIDELGIIDGESKLKTLLRKHEHELEEKRKNYEIVMKS